MIERQYTYRKTSTQTWVTTGWLATAPTVDVDADTLSSTRARVNDHHHHGADGTEQSTTSNQWQTALSLDAGTIDAGNYKMEWSAEVLSTTGSTSVAVRVTSCGETVMDTVMDIENNDWFPMSGWDEQTCPGGAHSMVFEFRSTSIGDEVKIRRVRLCGRME